MRCILKNVSQATIELEDVSFVSCCNVISSQALEAPSPLTAHFFLLPDLPINPSFPSSHTIFVLLSRFDSFLYKALREIEDQGICHFAEQTDFF